MDALPSMKPARVRARVGVTRVEVSGFRSARDVAFSPAPLCALVGEADAGKSNLLAAIRAVLDPAAAPLTAADMTAGGEGEVSIRVRLADGSEATLKGSPGRTAVTGDATAPPTLFLPAEERAGALLAAWTPRKKAPPSRSSSGRSPSGRRRWQHGRWRLLQAVESCSSQRPRRSLAPDRGAGALSPPAGAALPLPPPARVLARRESGHLLDAIAGLPQRHAAWTSSSSSSAFRPPERTPSSRSRCRTTRTSG